MIGIITHTNASGPSPWIAKCVESVRQTLPLAATHVIQTMSKDYAVERFDAVRAFDFVGFVDDDDIVYPEAIEVCAKALASSDAGIAYTQQERIDADGNFVGPCGAATRYLDVAMSPQGIHHFALIRRDAVSDEVLTLATEIGIGIDWLIKANAALRHGAIYIPRVGYGWRQHSDQDSKAKDAAFRSALPRIRDITLSWIRNNNLIPRYS